MSWYCPCGSYRDILPRTSTESPFCTAKRSRRASRAKSTAPMHASASFRVK